MAWFGAGGQSFTVNDPEPAGMEDLRQKLDAVCHRHLRPEAADLVVTLARPAVRLRHSTQEVRSHLGGSAQLARSAEWPTWRDKPLALVAVLDLAEISHLQTDLELPAVGLLNFFYDAEDQQAWGFDPSHKDGWRVIYVDAAEAVVKGPPPGTATFPTIGVVANQTLTVPGWEEPAVESIFPPHKAQAKPRRLHRRHRSNSERDDERRGAFFAMQDEWHQVSDSDTVPNHQVGGWPRLQQNPIWRECDVASQGFPLGTAAQAADPRLADLPRREFDWQLLLQLDTDEDAGWMWGDLGTLFYAVRRSTEIPESFRDAWMVFQCG